MTMNVQGPGGITVAFPDGTDSATIDQVMRQATGGRGDRQPMAAGAVPHAMPPETAQGGPTPAPPSVASDIADSAASRYQAGLLDIPGAPGDLTSLADTAGSAAAQGILKMLGVSPEARQKAHAVGDAIGGNPLSALPGSEDIKKAVGFEAYQPQTETGKTFDKWGGGAIEMAPSVAVSGGAGVIKKGLEEGIGAAVKKGAGDVAKYAAAPAVAGEAAGEATKGTALEPWARLGASLLTAVAAGGRGAKTGDIKAKTLDDLKAESQDLYAQAKQQGVMVKPAVLNRAIGDITKNAAAFGIDPTIHPKAFAALKRLNEFKDVAPVNGVKTVASLEDIDMMRQILGDAASSMDKADAMRAMQMRDQLDSFMNGLKPGDVISKGDPRAAVNMLIKARSLWSQKAKGETIAELFRRAELSAPNFSGSGAENAIRTEFRLLAKNQKRMRQFNRDERAAIEGVAKGAPMGNLLRMLGKMAPTGVVSAALSGGAGAVIGGMVGMPQVGAVALPLAGGAARKAATLSTLNRARAVDELVRGGKPGQRIRRPSPVAPMSVFYGAAAGRSSDETK